MRNLGKLLKKLKAMCYLMRWPNLFLLTLLQYLVIYRFIPDFIMDPAQQLGIFLVLSASIGSLAAGGNLINAVVDVPSDSINKPKRVEALHQLGVDATKTLSTLFFGVGLVAGGVVSFLQESFFLSLVFGIVAFVLWQYSYKLKGSFLCGNLVVSCLVGLSLFLPFWIYVKQYSFTIQDPYIQLFWVYVFFAFLTNMMREVVKDAEDIIGDYACLHQTFPIRMGKKRTNLLVQWLSFFCILGLTWVYYWFFNGKIVHAILIFLGYIPCAMYIFIKAGKARYKKDYTILSTFIKVWMLLGLLSMGLVRW